MRRKKSKKVSHDYFTRNAAASQKYAETCKACGQRVPWGQGRLRAQRGLYVCDECNEDSYDLEIRGKSNE